MLLNLIWLIFGGLWLALGYVLAGIICFVLIITIPFGVASFRMANYALWPFGRSVVQPVTGSGSMSTFSNIVWFVVAGLWLAIGHVTTAAAHVDGGALHPGVFGADEAHLHGPMAAALLQVDASHLLHLM